MDTDLPMDETLVTRRAIRGAFWVWNAPIASQSRFW